jgi:hypothetical protein
MEGDDYFYQLNDDIKLLTKGWTEIFVNKLKSNPLLENFGMVGPLDTNNPRIFTQAFCHRTHYLIFGYFYPFVFKNWYSDDWVLIHLILILGF